jgi:hypothetical protein
VSSKSVSTFRALLVAALGLDAGLVAFLLATGRGLSGMRGTTMILVSAVVAVGTLVSVIQRRLQHERVDLHARTNAAVRALAGEAGLTHIEPPAAGTGFAEARGSCSGGPVTVSVVYPSTDDLFTSLHFPGRQLSPAALDQLRPLVDRIDAGGGGLTLLLGRRSGLFMLTNWDHLPETDSARLLAVLRHACALFPSAAPEAAPRGRSAGTPPE